MSHKEGERRREYQGDAERAFLHALFAFTGKDFQD